MCYAATSMSLRSCYENARQVQVALIYALQVQVAIDAIQVLVTMEMLYKTGLHGYDMGCHENATQEQVAMGILHSTYNCQCSRVGWTLYKDLISW